MCCGSTHVVHTAALLGSYSSLISCKRDATQTFAVRFTLPAFGRTYCQRNLADGWTYDIFTRKLSDVRPLS